MEKDKIEVGSICRVINTEMIYLSFNEFARNAGQEDILHIKRESTPLLDGKIVRVTYLGPHNTTSGCKILAIVETGLGLKYMRFIINIEGLKSVKQITIDSASEEYLSGKPLKEKVPNACVSKALIEAIIARNPMDLQFIDVLFLTDDHYRRILIKDGGLLGLIPEKRRTLELCRLAVENEEYAKNFIPANLKSLASC